MVFFSQLIQLCFIEYHSFHLFNQFIFLTLYFINYFQFHKKFFVDYSSNFLVLTHNIALQFYFVYFEVAINDEDYFFEIVEILENIINLYFYFVGLNN